jgi:hypothetical protein
VTIMVGRLVLGPKMLEIVDLQVGSSEQACQWYSDLISSFGISRASPSLLPTPLGPDELREKNYQAGQRLGLNFPTKT